MPAITPENSIFAALSFEGPDGYSNAGGLGVRMTELCRALAESGFETHLYFVGDPDAPGEERHFNGKLILHRWCQWVSAYHRGGVYDGEPEKINEYQNSIPHALVQNIIGPAAAQGKKVYILAEEWHTASTVINLHNYLTAAGLRNHCVIFWNANNTYGFWNINWTALRRSCTITTVSRYMKHIMWDYGLNPMAIPNGIPRRFLEPLDRRGVEFVQSIFMNKFFLVKFGRYTPDKRWIPALETVRRLKDLGYPVCLIMRGGMEPYRAEVLSTAYHLGLRVKALTSDDVGGRSFSEVAEAIINNHPHYDLIEMNFYVPDEFRNYMFAAADAVLANSAHEPFGIVGLEVMAMGGIPFVGASGEDYARAFQNSIIVETDDANEAVSYLLYLADNPRLINKIRGQARQTAEMFTWDRVIEDLLGKLEYIARAFGVIG